MPLHVMLSTMRKFWKDAHDEEGNLVNMDEAVKAHAIAKDVAPYCHPKLTNIDLRAYAEMNARVEHSQVVDVSRLNPQARNQLRTLLLTALAEQEPEEVDGEYEVRED